MALKTAANTAKKLNLKPKTPLITRKKPPLLLASDIMPRDMTWLWHPYIPNASASLIFGPGGHGKSHITVEIAAALTSGRPLPGQTRAGAPQKVLMLSAEDDFDVVLVPRLMRAGARLDYVGLPADPFTLDADGLKMLEAYMHEFAATVVFIDPIVHYMGGKVDMFRANEVRAFMGGLHQLAMKHDTAVIVVGHSRKSRAEQTGDDWEQIMGSADFSNAVRSVMFVTKANDGSRVMRHVKANYSALGETLGFAFEDDYFKWTGVVEETGEMSPDLSKLAKGRTKVETWLISALSNGRVGSKDLEARAKAAGFSWRTVNRYKSSVAESFMEMHEGRPVWFWTLRADVEGEPDELYVPSVEDRDELEAPDSGRGSAGRSIVRKAPASVGGAVSGMGGRGPVARGEALPAGPAEAAPRDPKAIARAFLEGRA